MKTITANFAFVFFILVTQTHAQTFLTNGLVAYYPFTGNAKDTVGTNDGTVFNATLANDRFGNLNQAYFFNGTNAYIQCSDSHFPAGNNPRTVSLWILFASFGVPSAVNQVFVSYGSSPAYDMFYGILLAWFALNNPIAVGQGDGGFSPYWPGTQLNKWYQVAFSHDGSHTKLYIDGILQGAITRTYSTTLNGSFYIGNDLFGYPPTFNGMIDDVRVYNRALSDQEISQLYDFESGPRLTLIKALKPTFTNLWVGFSYQLQVSGDNFNTWTNQGLPMTATNTSFVYPQYFDVPSWDKLFFRLLVVP